MRVYLVELYLSLKAKRECLREPNRKKRSGPYLQISQFQVMTAFKPNNLRSSDLIATEIPSPGPQKKSVPKIERPYMSSASQGIWSIQRLFVINKDLLSFLKYYQGIHTFEGTWIIYIFTFVICVNFYPHIKATCTFYLRRYRR